MNRQSGLMTTASPSGFAEQAKGMVHYQIAATAKGIAGEFWEQMCTGNRKRRGVSADAWKAAARFRAANPDRDAYIRRAWPEFIEAARGAMLILLNRRDIAEPLKEAIYDALLKDGAVNPRHVSPEAAAAMAAKRPKL